MLGMEIVRFIRSCSLTLNSIIHPMFSQITGMVLYLCTKRDAYTVFIAPLLKTFSPWTLLTKCRVKGSVIILESLGGALRRLKN